MKAAELGAIEDNQTFPQIAWSADGTLLAAIGYSGAFYVWHANAEQAPIFTAHFSSPGYATSFSCNGTLAAAEGGEVIILK